MKENALYKIICKECRKKEIRSEYWGETGRNCFLRGGEHIEGLKNKEEDNALWKHTWDVHDGEGNSDTFEMKLEKTFKKPLERQIREGVELEMCTADIVMNSKAEWNGSRIPQIIIEVNKTLNLFLRCILENDEVIRRRLRAYKHKSPKMY